jgi:hypothetical protein
MPVTGQLVVAGNRMEPEQMRLCGNYLHTLSGMTAVKLPCISAAGMVRARW